MEKQWIKDLRKRFDDRKAPVPEGLWDDIESAMAEAGADAVDGSTGKRRARIVPLWGRWSAAAAVCVALVVGLIKYSQPAPTELASVGSASHKSADVSAAKSSDNVAYESASTDEAGDAVQPALSRLKAGVAAVVERAKERAAVDSVRVETADENLVADAGVPADKENKAAETAKKEVSVVRHQPSGRRQSPYRADNDDLLAVSSHKRHDSSVSVGVYGANFMSIGGTSNGGMMSQQQMNAYVDPVLNKDFVMLTSMNDNLRAAETEENEVKVKHRQPVRLGMSVRFKLLDRLGVETGMSYSYLSSDIASGDDEGGFRTEQKLHYVGIPLGVNYDIWKTDFLEVYASAGTMAEFCVSGRSSTEYVSDQTIMKRTETDMKDSRPQWSVNAAAGVQYNFSNLLGLYVEPGVSYYFDNGSSVSNIYKDKPFNFNLNLGLRFTIR